MNINYSLNLGMFHSLKQINDLNDVVMCIEYTYVGTTEVDGTTHTYAINNSANLIANVKDLNQDNFITFDDITEDLAKQWVLESISEIELDLMQKTILHNIENQTKVSVKRPPWVKITEGQPNPQQVEK
jgi:hypothetical protein